MNRDPEKQLEHSWHANAAAWSNAVREGAIPSRLRGTNAAIVEAVLALRPTRVLDVGCGEGWLARELAGHGIEAVGVDASPLLIEHARATGGARFLVGTYAQLASEPDRIGSAFDAIVCNFSLFEEKLLPMLRALRTRLAEKGALVVQTVHPWTAGGGQPYVDGWRTETFATFGSDFSEPMPWYFRTLESWVGLIRESGYTLHLVREPVDDDSGEPLSLLLVARADVPS